MSNIKYLTFDDQSYRIFMIKIMQHLEPRRELKGTILYDELEEISEVFFLSKGSMDIGYEINRIRKFVLRHTDKIVVGAYNCSFNKRSMFIYKCQTECIGYFIRKQNWVEICAEDKYIDTYIKENVRKLYNNNIKRKVLTVKQMHMRNIAKRTDFEQILVISNKDGKGNPAGNIEIPKYCHDKDEMLVNSVESSEEDENSIEFKIFNYNSKLSVFGKRIAKVIRRTENSCDMNINLSIELEKSTEIIERQKLRIIELEQRLQE